MSTKDSVCREAGAAAYTAGAVAISGARSIPPANEPYIGVPVGVAEISHRPAGVGGIDDATPPVTLLGAASLTFIKPLPLAVGLKPTPVPVGVGSPSPRGDGKPFGLSGIDIMELVDTQFSGSGFDLTGLRR